MSITKLADLKKIEETYSTFANYEIEGKVVRIDEKEGIGFYSNDGLQVEYLGVNTEPSFIQSVFKVTIGSEVRYDFLTFSETSYLDGLVHKNFSRKEITNYPKKILDFISQEYYSMIK